MNISFQPLSEHDYPDFQNDVKDVFSIALIEQFGLPQDKEFFMDDDINETFHNPKLVTYYIYADEKKLEVSLCTLTTKATTIAWSCFIYILNSTIMDWAYKCGT